jgi:phosphoribosylformylglycinamidine synthase subunit PurSL
MQHNLNNISVIQIFLKDSIKDVKAEGVKADSLNYLNIETGKIKSGKIYVINYKLDNSELKNFADNCIKDSITDLAYINNTYKNPVYESYILVAKMPGVTDDEGISTQKTLSDYLNTPIDTKTQHIFTQELYLIEKELSGDKLNLIAEKLLGNKLVNHFEYGKYKGEFHYIPEVKMHTDETIKTIDIFINDKELLQLSKNMLLALNLEEMKAIQNYYKRPEIIEQRKTKALSKLPTDCEIEIFAQTWSEHCKHKEFNAIINYENTETGENKIIDSLFKTYIKGSTDKIKKKLEKNGHKWLIKVFSDNAGVVRLNNDNVFVWKVETHNSPSAIDPYGGAITGILGNNRDPLGTGIGGGKLLFNTNVLCFGSPFYNKELLPGQLHPKRVFDGVRKGIEDGGNKSGIPTVNGSIIFDDRYSGKPLVYCGTGSIMPVEYKGRKSWEKKIDDGDLIIMAGGRVGKDGIHGATFSSAELDEHSPQSAVQIGSPFTQKLVADFLEIASKEGLIKCSTDNGAGGLSSSIGELATISGGACVNLENVPLKYSGLKPWEIFLSESQERMTLVVEKQHINELFKLAEEMEVELSEIGYFSSSGYLDVRYKNNRVAYLELNFLHEGVPKKKLEARWEKPKLSEPKLMPIKNYNEILLKLMSSLNICSREPVIRQYDHEVKGKTLIKPLMGKEGKAPQDSALMSITFPAKQEAESYTGIAISNGIIPRYGDINPYEMSAGSFDEAVRQIISIGGELPDLTAEDDNLFWSVNDNFCVPDSVYNEVDNPDGKQKLAKLVQMCEALYDMATFFNIPMTSGKDSMKNDFKSGNKKISVPPTILYSMTAKIKDIRKTITSEFKSDGDLIYILGKTYDEMGATEFYKLYGELGANVPKVRKEKAKELYNRISKANKLSLIESSHDISDGGIIVALVESAFGGDMGAEIDLSTIPDLNTTVKLFSESHSRFIVSIKPENKETFDKIFDSDDTALLLGRVTKEKRIIVKDGNKNIINIDTHSLLTQWNRGLEQETVSL